MKEIDDCEHCFPRKQLCDYHFERMVLESLLALPNPIDWGEGGQVGNVITAFVETFDVVPAMYRERFGGGK